MRRAEKRCRLWSTGPTSLFRTSPPGRRIGSGWAPRSSDARNPRLIHVSISGYGTGGPYSSKKAYDLLVQCEAGLVSITGTEDEPSKVGISIADIASGMYAYTGVLTAVIQRERTGEGATIEMSMLEALVGVDGLSAQLRHVRGRVPLRAPERGTRPSLRTVPFRAATATRSSSASRTSANGRRSAS